jgi:signal-transduction protein with cAMP-binding, CBS, and nucleotidyltransferase domain
MLVRECLRRAPVTVPPQCTLQEAAALMQEDGVGAVLVVDGDALVGIVTDRDLAVRGAAQGLGPHQHVEDVMTEAPVTIQGSDDLLVAFAVLRQAGVRRLPVLEETDIAGIIPVDDPLVRLERSRARVPASGFSSFGRERICKSRRSCVRCSSDPSPHLF